MTQVQTPPTRRSRPGRSGGRRWLPILIIVIVVVGLGIGAFAIVNAINTSNHNKQVAADNTAAGQVALQDGLKDIGVMNTMDYTHVTADLQDWLNVTAGTLHGQLTQAMQGTTFLFTSQQVRVTGKVLTSKAMSADSAAGTALIGGTEDVTRIQGNGTPQVIHEIFTANMQNTPTGWKITQYTTTPARN
ncbi:MAG TPA: hypothetical protein VG317_10560 [Pseudonocardiaceae bacterium]|jgi:hypothetical protein|nr:hypothetical protein [Pseudonocardiaceae bacterium]